MADRLANRLSASRLRRFVGRSAELELFRAALSRELPDFAVLHIHGPGGMGKSTLLREFARLAVEAGRFPLLLDCRHLDPSPAGFLTGLQLALQLPPDADPLESLASGGRPVLLLDTYELAAPLDGWLREVFLPRLPERALAVIAGRQPPPAAWRADDGWGELTRIVSLRNLRPDESAAYLTGQGIPQDEAARLLDVTFGHPLALSLAADLFRQNAALPSRDLRRDPDILKALLERFVADVPNPVLRQALEVCAHSFTTDESLLAHCLGAEQGYAAFQWLRGLSFIEQGPFGLFPHDLAREALEADLRWRNPQRFREMHFQVRGHIIQQILSTGGMAQQYAIFALLFLHRNNPFMRPYYEWQSLGHFYIDDARPADMPVIEEMILRHQGEESLAITRFWQKRPNSTFLVFRGAGQAIAGFCHSVEISQASSEETAMDPAVRGAVAHLAGSAPLLPGEQVLLMRNWMDAESYQDSPAIFNMGSMVSLRQIFGTPRLAYYFVAQRHSERYAGMFDYLRIPLAPQAAFVIDGQPFGVFGHDWRIEPPLEWIEVMGERELLDEIVPLENQPGPGRPVLLSEPEFAEAVRQALKDLRRPDLLALNPLLRSRCLRERSDGEPTPALLQALLGEGADLLTATPRSRKLHRVLWHTFFEPAPTQEAAAELLDLPFSTYRYQLGKAVDEITGWLWQQEIYGKRD